jgi:hypothetical protein
MKMLNTVGPVAYVTMEDTLTCDSEYLHLNDVEEEMMDLVDAMILECGENSECNTDAHRRAFAESYIKDRLF